MIASTEENGCTELNKESFILYRETWQQYMGYLIAKTSSSYFNEVKSKTASTIELDATLGKAPLPVELCLQTSMRLTHRETSKKYPEFKHDPPFILLEYDVIVHLCWNDPQHMCWEGV